MTSLEHAKLNLSRALKLRKLTILPEPLPDQAGGPTYHYWYSQNCTNLHSNMHYCTCLQTDVEAGSTRPPYHVHGLCSHGDVRPSTAFPIWNYQDSGPMIKTTEECGKVENKYRPKLWARPWFICNCMWLNTHETLPTSPLITTSNFISVLCSIINYYFRLNIKNNELIQY